MSCEQPNPALAAMPTNSSLDADLLALHFLPGSDVTPDCFFRKVEREKSVIRSRWGARRLAVFEPPIGASRPQQAAGSDPSSLPSVCPCMHLDEQAEARHLVIMVMRIYRV